MKNKSVLLKLALAMVCCVPFTFYAQINGVTHAG